MDAIEEKLTTDLTRSAEAADLTSPDVDDVLASVARDRRRRRVRTGLLVAAAAVAVAGTASVLTMDDASRTDIADNPEPTAPQPGPIPSTAPTTTTTQALPPTTASPSPADSHAVAETIPLRAQGIGAFAFGASSADAATVTAAITAELGAPMSEVPPFEPPLPPCGNGMEPLGPPWRVASEVQWAGLVVWFAGPDSASQYLVGYSATNRAPTTSDDANPAVRMADGPALTDPLDVWEEAYGDAMVDRNEGDPTMVRSFDIQLDDGPVGAQQLTPGQGTARVWEVNAGASCDDAG